MSAGLFGMDLERIFKRRPHEQRTWTPSEIAQMIRALDGNGLGIVADLIRALVNRVKAAERRLVEPIAGSMEVKALLINLDGSTEWIRIPLLHRGGMYSRAGQKPNDDLDAMPEYYRRDYRWLATWRADFAGGILFDVFEEQRR